MAGHLYGTPRLMCDDFPLLKRHRNYPSHSWPSYPNCQMWHDFAIARPLVNRFYQRIEYPAHRDSDGHILAHYAVAVPVYPAMAPLCTKRYFFTHFHWRDGKVERTITRAELIAAWCRLLEAHDLLFNVRLEVNDIRDEPCAICFHPASGIRARKASASHVDSRLGDVLQSVEAAAYELLLQTMCTDLS